jgi:hypothetical protein
MSDSPLTRADLDALLIPAGEVFGRIFKATRGMTREEALVVAQEIHLGTWIAPERADRSMKVGSVWEFFVNLPWMPSTAAPNPMWASKSDVRRMIEQGAIRLNWHTDWKPDDEMPPIITEITLFPSGARCTTLFLI